jgi:hypothetical protein
MNDYESLTVDAGSVLVIGDHETVNTLQRHMHTDIQD